MKTGKSLTALAAEVERQAGTKRDFVADTRALTLHSNGVSRLEVAGQGDGDVVNDHAHGQIAAHTGIPKPYYDRLRAEAPTLLDQNVNNWLHTKPARRLVRTLDGGVRALLSDRYRRLDNEDLLAHALPILLDTPGLSLASCEITDTRLYIKATTDRIQGEVNVGDVVQAGLLISNSEVGGGAVSVQPLSYRLVCLNGAVHTDFGTRKNHVGRVLELEDGQTASLFRDDTLEADDQAFFLKVRDLISGALSHKVFDRILVQMRDAAGAKLEGDPVKAVEVLSARFRLLEAERHGVLRSLIEGRDLSVWGLANALTDTSKASPSYDRATELEALGGGLLSTPDEWKPLVEAR